VIPHLRDTAIRIKPEDLHHGNLDVVFPGDESFPATGERHGPHPARHDAIAFGNLKIDAARRAGLLPRQFLLGRTRSFAAL